MSLFDSLIKHGLPLIPKFVVGRVAKRYVAGETLDDACRTIRNLNAEGIMATVDVLGEEIVVRDKVEAAVATYIKMFDTIDELHLDCNVSIKLTMLGLRIDESYCVDNVRKILDVAASHGNFVRIDMEDHTCTDFTLRAYRELRAGYDNVGVVLQARLRRTLDDIGGLLDLKPNVRLCKGIYFEPRKRAWPGYRTVQANFIAALDKLLEHGSYVGIATHDEHLVWAGMTAVDRLGLSPEQYEFQMLLGVDPELRRIILDSGHRLRVYVPFGPDWYPYSSRRLRENPTVARHVIRAMVGLRSRE
ncbi:MAG: proline dehydrogenase [Acidobacteria bacterium]|nr:proline dehydrogenase [Acidobacteriota bacterium]